jgi:hypothetical protein
MNCHRETARKRLQKAHPAGYVNNIQRLRNQPALYEVEENPPEPVTALPELSDGWDGNGNNEEHDPGDLADLEEIWAESNWSKSLGIPSAEYDGQWD